MFNTDAFERRFAARQPRSGRAWLLPRLLAAACCILGPSGAWAAMVCSTPNLPGTLNIPATKVSPDLPVGQPIPGASAVAHIHITCSGATFKANTYWQLREYPTADTTKATSWTNVYSNSSLPKGVGYSVKSSTGATLPFVAQGGVNGFNIGPASGQLSFDLTYSLVLVKTGTLPTTVTPVSFKLALSVPAIAWANQPAGTSNPANSIRTYVGSVQQLVPTCSVATDSTAIVVNLPKVPAASFPGTNATAGGTPFQINLNCAANSNVAVNFSDANLFSNESNYLALATGSTATGVGIQLTSGGAPIQLVVADQRGGTELTGKITSSAGMVSFPLAAQYIRTGTPAVGPGTVKAGAIFNVYYQ